MRFFLGHDALSPSLSDDRIGHSCLPEYFNCYSCVLDRLESAAYESMMHATISSSVPVATDHSPCHPKFHFPKVKRRETSFVLYIRMMDGKDFGTWLQVAKCFHVWDLDARGQHRGMWRMNYQGHAFFIVGVPFSDYS